MLNGDGVGIGVQVRKGLIFRDPAAVHLVSDGQLTRFVVQLDDDVFAEIFERDFSAETGAEVPYLVGPLFKFAVVGDASFKRDGVVLCAAGRFAATARVAALAVLDHLRGALKHADLADARDISAIPLDAEFKVLVRIKPSCVYAKLGHISPL